jgi:hypothetical protein
MLIAFSGDLLALWQSRFHPSQINKSIAAVGLLNDAGHYFTDAV